MRIGLVCPYSLSVFGGVQDQVLGLGRALRRLGHDVRVLGPSDGAPPAPGVTSLGASIPTVTNGSIAPIAPDVSCALRTIRALWDEGFDVLNLHEPAAPGPTHTALILAPCPMVGTFHRSGETWLYDAPGIHWGVRRLTARVAVSPEAAAQAERAIGGRYARLWNGVEVQRIRSAVPWPTDGPTVMFLGREEPRKGLEVLLEAFGDLPRETRLWVVGPGTERSELRRRHGNDHRISWLGEVTNREKWSRLRGADVMCAPSLSGESFGVVLIEGMAAGTPVVASDIPGYRSVVRTGREAGLFPAGDAGALAKELLAALFEAPRREALIAAGTECAESFSMLNLAQRYLEIFEPLVTADRPSVRRRPTPRRRILGRRGV